MFSSLSPQLDKSLKTICKYHALTNFRQFAENTPLQKQCSAIVCMWIRLRNGNNNRKKITGLGRSHFLLIQQPQYHQGVLRFTGARRAIVGDFSEISFEPQIELRRNILEVLVIITAVGISFGKCKKKKIKPASNGKKYTHHVINKKKSTNATYVEDH